MRGIAARWPIASLAVAIGAVTLVGCGGEAGTAPIAATTSTQPTSTRPPTSVGVETTVTTPYVAPSPKLRLVPPAGWVASGDGLTVAETADDLNSSDPVGQRVADITVGDVPAYLAEPMSMHLAGEPWETTVAGFPSLAVTLTVQSAGGLFRASTTLAVDTGAGTFQVFLLQAPAVGYVDAEPTLLAAIQPASSK